MTSYKNTPKHWPTNIRYLKEPVYHPSVSPSTLVSLRQLDSGSSKGSTSIGDCDSKFADYGRSLCTIRPIRDALHPANGQCGLFYTKKLPVNTFVLDYIGEVHTDDRPQSDYDLSLYRFANGPSVGIDAARMGNEGRFINDYRGVRDKPNAEFRERKTDQGELRMSVWTTAPVQKGEEVLVSYGKQWWKERKIS